MQRKAKFLDAEDDELLNSKNMSEDSVDIHRDDYRKLIKTIKKQKGTINRYYYKKVGIAPEEIKNQMIKFSFNLIKE